MSVSHVFLGVTHGMIEILILHFTTTEEADEHSLALYLFCFNVIKREEITRC